MYTDVYIPIVNQKSSDGKLYEKMLFSRTQEIYF